MVDVIASDIIGAIVIARHGDRQGFYQDPISYTASATAITPLGEDQEFQLGSLIRSIYLNASSPKYIQGISPATDLFQQTQVAVRADAGGEGGVIFDSSIALVQGLWPPTSQASISLANGSTVTSPLGGYQYIPIESVEPNEDVSLEGFTDCSLLTAKTTKFYNSSAFLEKQAEAQSFLNSLPPFLDGRPVTLSNMFNIFDYMNVQSIHNVTFATRLPPTYLEQARALANYHEYGIFTDPSFDGIGNIAGRTMLPSLVTALQRIVNNTDPLKLHYSAISYKPFLSLFNMTGVVATGQIPAGIVNYAAAVVMEVHQPSAGGQPFIRFNFKNGTDDATFNLYNLSFPGFDGGSDVPVPTFIDAFQPAGVNNTQWCNVCSQNTTRGCSLVTAASSSHFLLSPHHDKISPVGAGFLGACLTIVVMSALVAALIFFGLLSVGKKRRHHEHVSDKDGSSVGSLHKGDSLRH
ncbi:Histidine phosphatase superfamily protein [Abortiporus biennis]